MAALLAAGCQTPSQTIEAAPVATTTAADTQGVIPRFTNDIWPAINAYRSELGQGSPGYQQWTGIIATLDADQYGKLRDATQELGQRRREDVMQGKPGSDSDLKLVDAALVESRTESVVIQACYTYTVGTYPNGNAQPSASVPSASEAAFELRKTDNWYLSAITNDHVVQGCPASPKV
ncbi:hypothetical protein ONA92_17290 [Mycobacteroides salmoniphilum]|uniref:hypothetical protein n=1 Tax=Mycobacteroides salmoniphilum TaxID=404941 RepID=UPI003565845C